jgi:hypothetical protein
VITGGGYLFIISVRQFMDFGGYLIYQSAGNKVWTVIVYGYLDFEML